MKNYPDVDPNPHFPALEEEILAFWRAENVFARSVAQRTEKNPDGTSNAYVFYDGPPFANGLPHYGHLLTGYVKDAIARYHTMQGRRVERRFGWDCHGLPAEMGAEKELGISGRAAIQGYGIGKFNVHCRNSVMKYTADWEYYVTRQGRWVDFNNDYKTMDTPYMESVLWAFKQLHEKGLIYESMRVMPYSWAAETPVSNFETRIDNATRPREDKAAYVKFKLNVRPEGAPEADAYYLIAWTTTPWTLPSNLALAVNAGMEYGCYVTQALPQRRSPLAGEPNRLLSDLAPPQGGSDAEASVIAKDCYIVARSAEGKVAEQLKAQWASSILGSELVGAPYEPLFPYFADTPNAFRVLDGSEFVTDGDGTGIVHIAPGFGEADYDVCVKNNIPVIVPVDEKGRFTAEIFDIAWIASDQAAKFALAGLTVVADTRIPVEQIAVSEADKARHISEKDVAKYGLANMRIVRWLKANNKLVKDEPYTHNYPHCWRTDTPLIYRAMSSWYVNVQKIKADMAENNQTIRWIPDHVQGGQMGKGIESAPDWSISRNRFWGTPIPIWKSASGKMHVCGSIEEIERLSGTKVTDLHRPYIDEVVLKIGGEDYTRIEDVFDCWFESGSMPFAQVHYPFENKGWFEENFPADFITEYIAQTRGWFYTLQVLSAALFQDAQFLKSKGVQHSAPFKNVICHGVVIDEETGLKYSKRLKNYRDPKEVMDNYGADALRWMMLASPVMRGSDLGVDPDGKFIRDVVRLNIKPIWSAYNFFTLYANADGIVASRQSSVTSKEGAAFLETGDRRLATNLLDRYILAKARAAVEAVRASLDAYDTPGAAEAITGFFEVLNNWYIRRSRSRFWAEELSADKQAAYDTLFTVLDLMCRAAAPLLPFTTEVIYRGLHGVASPHQNAKHSDSPSRGEWASGDANSVETKKNSSPLEGEPKSSSEDFGGGITSVHLTDFPDVSWIVDDGDVELMDRVRDVCNAASAIRNKMNIRNRQPLSELRLEGKFAPLVLGFAEEIIKEEVNVKKVYSKNTDFSEFAIFKVSLNNAVLGKKYPEKMKQIIPAAKKGDYQPVSHDTIQICGEILRPNEFSMIFEPKPEFKDRAQALSTNDALVILDLTITPELEAEGRARDLVRMIQQARKDAGLHVADRIALAVDIPPEFESALATHRDFIATQTLAVSLTQGSATADQQVRQELDGVEFMIGISKVA